MNTATVHTSAQPAGHIDSPHEYDTAIFSAASQYLARCWRILPFERGGGKCYLSKEQAAAFKAHANTISHQFTGKDVGIDIGDSGLVDVDVDCPEAARFAAWLLPQTATIKRPGKPVSHLLYQCSQGISTAHFCDLNGEEMIALLPKNRLALPPSTHPGSGEKLAWCNDATPATQVDAGIVRLIREVAALSLIARRWPGAGARHEPTLALAGTLCRSGWSQDKTLEAVRLISKLTNDTKLADREAEVASTYKRYEGGDTSITGLPRLAELLTSSSSKASKLDAKVRQWLELANDEYPGPHGAALSQYALPLQDFLALKEHEVEYLVHPIVPKESLSMVFAARGVGKTWFTMQLALCLSRGADFFAWPVPKARRVLLIDGEMQPGYLQRRWKALLKAQPVPHSLRILSVAQMWRNDDSLAINALQDQSRIEECLRGLEAAGERPDLIVLDNLSSLMVGLDENSNSELDTFVRWLIKLRSRGYAVLVVHHSGKNKEQRGASRREDLLDTVIKLESADGVGLNHGGGACFDIQFTKLRGERPKPDRLRVALNKDEAGHLSWATEGLQQDVAAYLNVVQALANHKPATQAALAKVLHISPQAVNRQIKIAQGKGLIDSSGIKLTAEGKAHVEDVSANQPDYDDCL